MKKILFCLASLYAITVSAEFNFMLESGAVWQHRNDVKIPGNTGTRVNFDEFNQGPFFHYRGELYWKITDNHNLRAVYAPLNIAVKGRLPGNALFDGVSFSTSEELEVNYKFNSYRLTYFYSYWQSGKSFLNLGVTGKIRDAEIEFKQPSQKASYDNVGFVPLLFVEYQAPIGSDWLFHTNIDAAAAPQGRAIDLTVKFRRPFMEKYKLGFGLRSLEGGADNDKVFTFSWLNYAILDISGEF